MERSRVLVGTCLGLLVAAAFGPAQAAVILDVDRDGKLRGASGVDVRGSFYDVEFVDGSCIDSPCDPACGCGQVCSGGSCLDLCGPGEILCPN